jgi:hypothetical protein
MIAKRIPVIKSIPKNTNDFGHRFFKLIASENPHISAKQKKIEMYIGCSPTNGMSMTALLMNDESLNKNFGDL